MSGKALDERTPYGEKCYQQGVADTHARYEAMQEQTRAWLKAVIELVGEIESTQAEHTYARRVLAPKLRGAVSLDPSVQITHEPSDPTDVVHAAVYTSERAQWLDVEDAWAIVNDVVAALAKGGA